MQISSLSRTVREGILDFAWAQWTQMGAAGVQKRTDRWAIDPEALLVFTLQVAARRDVRLFDEVLDWLASDGQLISTQRVKNLARGMGDASRLVSASMAWAGSRNAGLRAWTSAPRPPKANEPVIDFGLRTRDPDEVFRSFGVWRPLVQPSGKSTEPVSKLPVNFAFRLRLLFGVGSRAEVLRYLLTIDRPESNARQITDAAAFAKRNVSETLTALTQAKVLIVRWRGNERVYGIDHGRWAALLGGPGGGLPAYVDWLRLLPVLRRLLDWVEDQVQAGLSDYMLASEARRLIEELRSDLESVGVQLPDTSTVHGVDFWPVFADIVGSTLQLLRPGT